MNNRAMPEGGEEFLLRYPNKDMQIHETRLIAEDLLVADSLVICGVLKVENGNFSMTPHGRVLYELFRND